MRATTINIVSGFVQIYSCKGFCILKSLNVDVLDLCLNRDGKPILILRDTLVMKQSIFDMCIVIFLLRVINLAFCIVSLGP